MLYPVFLLAVWSPHAFSVVLVRMCLVIDVRMCEEIISVAVAFLDWLAQYSLSNSMCMHIYTVCNCLDIVLQNFLNESSFALKKYFSGDDLCSKHRHIFLFLGTAELGDGDSFTLDSIFSDL